MKKMTGRSLALAAVFAGVLGGIMPAPARADENADCAAAQAVFAKAEASARAGAAQVLLGHKCPSLPADLLTALRTGAWTDGVALDPRDRLDLLEAATAGRHAEAETLCVALLEEGRWPEGKPMTLLEGMQVIRALGQALTPFRVRLLLDVYDQQILPAVRVPIIRALGHSDVPGARLPAIDASYVADSELRRAVREVFATDAERDAELARLTRELPAGPMRDWALRLAAARLPATAKP